MTIRVAWVRRLSARLATALAVLRRFRRALPLWKSSSTVRLLDKKGRPLYDPRVYRRNYETLLRSSDPRDLGAYVRATVDAEARRILAELPEGPRYGLTDEDQTFLSGLKISWDGDER